MQLELQKRFDAITIHTGQHYDENMSAVFFQELNIPKPEYVLKVSGVPQQGKQTGLMMAEIEEICLSEKPDALLIYGDTNSTLAGALVAAKLLIPIIHLEAGLRSYNRSMPEEVNRIVADSFAKMLFCPTTVAIENLKKEGIQHRGVFLSGDVMCDTLELVRGKVKQHIATPYYFATLHRPYNTDDPERTKAILSCFEQLDAIVVFAIHPRTVAKMKQFGDKPKLVPLHLLTQEMSEHPNQKIFFIEPVGYLDSLSLQMHSKAVITDSGGMQKEAYMLRKKCVTIRTETEWVETLEGGWNTLVFDNLSELKNILKAEPSNYKEGLYGYGQAAAEIANIIEQGL